VVRPRPRRRPAPPLSAEDRAREAQRRRLRAREELLDVRVDERPPFPLLEVSNPLRGTHYRVYAPAYPSWEAASCDCTDFARRGLGTCKHLEAARAWAAERPEALHPTRTARDPEVAAVWKAIDARLGAAGSRRSRPAAQRWREPGAALYEIPPG
jgi:hypothetical protein